MSIQENPGQKRIKPGRYILLSLLLASIAFLVRRPPHDSSTCKDPTHCPLHAPKPDSVSVEDSPEPENNLTRVGEVRAGQGLFQVLDDLGIATSQSLKLVNALTDSVEILKVNIGEKISITLDSLDTTRVALFSYSPHPAVAHQLEDSAGHYVYRRIDHPTTVKLQLYEGVLEHGSSLDRTLRNLGIPGSMVGTVNGVLLCRIPFSTHARQGDKFRVLIRERFFEDTIRIESQVVYTSYDGSRAGKHEAFRFEDSEPKSSFTAHYTEDGQALIYSGLRYPLDRLHISSPYGMRRHPVFGHRAMHWGVDYRAPTGTPVYAVAEGVITASAYDLNNGHYVSVRHRDGYVSYYLHLHQRLVKKGQSVSARQMIGRVGNTGISSGPHLHFGMKQPNGSWMDPLAKRMIATPKLEGPRLQLLGDQIAGIRGVLDSLENSTSNPTTVALVE